MAEFDYDDMNYVVGRGRLFFGQFKPGTRRPRGQRYFGNTPALSTNQAEDSLDHYSMEGGPRVKDASAQLQFDSNGSFQCDNISLPNLALWFRGIMTQRIEAGSATSTGTVTFSTAVPAAGDSVTINGQEIEFVAANADAVGMQVAVGATIGETATRLANFINDVQEALGVKATVNAAVVTLTALMPGASGNSIALVKQAATPANITVSGATLTGGTDASETITDVERGLWYQLGVTTDNPQGISHIGSLTLTGVDEEDYTVDTVAGRFMIHTDASSVADGADVIANYGVMAGVDDIVIARNETIEGELQFYAQNAHGKNDNYFWPYVKLMPDGDFSLKGDDWMAITFNFEILKRDALTERQYITRRRAA